MKKNLLIAGMLAITLTANADDGYVPEVWGNIINMTSWDAMGEYSKPFGVYSFPAKTDGFKFTQLSKKSMIIHIPIIHSSTPTIQRHGN